MKLSIVIVNWNTASLLDRCLTSIKNYKTIVIDNASTDASCTTAKKHHVKLIKNKENCGMAKALNQGMRATTSDYILCLHPDTVVKPTAIETMIQYMDYHPTVAVLGPKMLYPDGTVFLSTHHFPTILNMTAEAFPLLQYLGIQDIYMRHANHSDEQSVDIIASAAIMFRRSSLETIGVLNEEFTNWMAEWELCYRMKKSGYDIRFIPSAEIIHFESQTPSNLRRGEMEYKKYAHHRADEMVRALFLFYKLCYGTKALRRVRQFTRLRFYWARMVAWLRFDSTRVRNYSRVIRSI